jgi:DNA polymerase-3 subunit epsilon
MKEHHSAKAHAKATAWAQSIAADPTALFLDTETTGLGDDAEICDLGVVRGDGTVVLDCLVKPTRPIPPQATQVHGITDAMVADAEPWEVVYGRLVEATWESTAIVVYNLSYDLGVMNRLNDRYGLQLFDGTAWTCALKAFSEWEGAPGRFPGSYRWWKLEEAAAKFGIPPGGHRALQDANAAREVVLAMASSGGERT